MTALAEEPGTPLTDVMVAPVVVPGSATLLPSASTEVTVLLAATITFAAANSWTSTDVPAGTVAV